MSALPVKAGADSVGVGPWSKRTGGSFCSQRCCCCCYNEFCVFSTAGGGRKAVIGRVKRGLADKWEMAHFYVATTAVAVHSGSGLLQDANDYVRAQLYCTGVPASVGTRRGTTPVFKKQVQADKLSRKKYVPGTRSCGKRTPTATHAKIITTRIHQSHDNHTKGSTRGFSHDHPLTKIPTRGFSQKKIT